MGDRIRQAGAVAWAAVGLAAVIALLGYVAYVVRVIWPPLILAAAIVFLLNPVVTRLQGRRVPRALGTAFSYLGVAAVVGLTILLVAPLATDQYDDLAQEWPELRADLEERIDDLSERSERDDWPIKIPTYEEIEDQLRGNDDFDTDHDGVIDPDERQARFADQLDTARELALQRVPRRHHLRARADHRLLPAGRPAPHPRRPPSPRARAGPGGRDGPDAAG